MTPEERARSVVLPWYRGPYNLHVDTSAQETEIADIAAAIRAAVEAERAACAVVAEACMCAGVNDIWPAAQRAIAADIRARKDTP